MKLLLSKKDDKNILILEPENDNEKYVFSKIEDRTPIQVFSGGQLKEGTSLYVVDLRTE